MNIREFYVAKTPAHMNTVITDTIRNEMQSIDYIFDFLHAACGHIPMRLEE